MKVKKKAAGKASGKAPRKAAEDASEKTSDRMRIEKELTEAIDEIDEQGLLFLLRQAQVLIHNARVDRLNREAEADSAPSKGTREPPKIREPDRAVVTIEQPEGGKTIFLTLGKARKVLTPEEMKRLVRICYNAETKSEALRQLFTVLARERKDVLADALIGNPDHPLLVALFTTIRERYRLEER